ncbi:hypothetical protein AALO_G00080190, partial [Alosa alosa]
WLPSHFLPLLPLIVLQTHHLFDHATRWPPKAPGTGCSATQRSLSRSRSLSGGSGTVQRGLYKKLITNTTTMITMVTVIPHHHHHHHHHHYCHFHHCHLSYHNFHCRQHRHHHHHHHHLYHFTCAHCGSPASIA